MSIRAIRWRRCRLRARAGLPISARRRPGRQRSASALRKEITALIGEKLNPSALDDLAKRLRQRIPRPHGGASRPARHQPRIRAGGIRGQIAAHPLRRHGSQVPLQLARRAGAAPWRAPPRSARTASRSAWSAMATNSPSAMPAWWRATRTHRWAATACACAFQFESYHEQWNRSTLDDSGRPAADARHWRPPALPHPPEFRAGGHVRAGQALDPQLRHQLRAVSRRSTRPRTPKPPTPLIAALRLPPPLEDGGEPARSGRRLQPARRHRAARQRFRVRPARAGSSATC